MQPVIEGQVSTDSAGGSHLRLRYRLSWPTLVLAVFWLSVTGAWVIAKLSQPIIDASLWEALNLFCAGSLLFTIPFWNEVTEARQLLTRGILAESATGGGFSDPGAARNLPA
nr:hypothetical protein [Tanacetum cinerariifolium]